MRTIAAALLVISAVTIAALVLALPGRAATFAVDSRADAPDAAPGDGVCTTTAAECTLRAAVEETNALTGGDAITLGAVTHRLKSTLEIDDDLTITGAGVDSLITFLGNPGLAAIQVSGPASVTMSDLRVSRVGLINAGGSLTLDHVTVAKSRSFFGGVRNDGGTLVLNDVAVVRTRSTGVGNINGGTATLTNVLLARNRGDGLFNRSTAMLTNVTIARNNRGAVTNVDPATVTLSNVTVTRNGYGFEGGGPLTLRNTLVVQKQCCRDPVLSLGHNLESGSTCGLSGPGDLSNIDPLIKASLRDNGGFTETLALLPGSPAIDGGDNTGCPATDQRGVARPQGTACDIGAYEFQP